MIYITQLIYIREGREEIFHEFEEIAIPTILKYNGRLTLRIRPDESTIVERSIDRPYEIHLIEFNTQEDFDNFKKDEDRKKILYLKEEPVRSSILIQGTKL